MLVQFLGPALLAGVAAWFAAGRNAAAVQAAAKTSQQTLNDVARINEQAAVRVAEINSESQKVIARNRMLWEYRSEQVRPLLRRANGRLAGYTAVEWAIYHGNWARARELLEPMLTDESPFQNTDYVGVVDHLFMRVASRFMHADARVAAQLDEATAATDNAIWDEVSDGLMRALLDAIGSLGLAAQRYVFEGPDPTPEQWARIVRLDQPTFSSVVPPTPTEEAAAPATESL